MALSASAGAPDPGYDVEFNLFGPIYTPRRGRVRITGFADGTSLFPTASPGSKIAPRTWRQQVRRRYSRAYFTRGTDHVVVEAGHVRKALVDLWGLDAWRVHVVPNAVNGVFNRPSSWLPPPLAAKTDKMRVCYIARAYPHKNIALLGAVGTLLRSQHGLDVEFILTLTGEEWEAQDCDVRAFSANIGPIDVAQAPMVYLNSDAAIFPSLLESFSASPLEALLMRCPLVASDRPFVSEFAGDAAEYFDPHSPVDAAEALVRVLTSPSRRELLVTRGIDRAREFSSPEKRASRYFDLIQRSLDSRCG